MLAQLGHGMDLHETRNLVTDVFLVDLLRDGDDDRHDDDGGDDNVGCSGGDDGGGGDDTE